MAKLRWGILGTGSITHAFVRGVSMSDHCAVLAVASRSLDKAKRFADDAGIVSAHGSYADLLKDDTVDAVYIATPHPQHAEWAILAAEAGKHILCEKPMALNEHQAHAMIQAAHEHDVLFMEAFMYRCHPQTARLVDLLREGAIGEVRMIEASFGFNGGFDPDSRLFNNALAGGGIMDVGCYPVSMARLIAGAVDGKPFSDPESVQGTADLVETGVDACAAAVLKFDNGIVAQVATAVQADLSNHVVIHGNKGRITLPNPWCANRKDAEDGRLILSKKGETQEIIVPSDRTSFAYEADHVAELIAEGKKQTPGPAMSWDDSTGNLRVLDLWRRGAKVKFEPELPEAQGRMTIANRPITKRTPNNMRYARIEGIDRDISRLFLGCDNQGSFAHAAVLFDDWLERGGNAFDTAHIYGGGHQETLIGQWIEARGVRDDIVLLSKGGHTPFCNPKAIKDQFAVSLDRLKTDHVELYIMHRDNPDIPVGEFVDVLNEFRDAGQARVFGGSNWSIERFEQANAYARKHGKQGLTVLNNNLSLAEMVKPVWDGCLHVSDPASRKWLTDHQVPNLAWSSQGRGYFLPESLRMRLGQSNFESWDSPENRARRERAEQLADKYGVSTINIAAAYVLCQPFPSFALIGPRNVHETATTLPALDLELTPDQLNWLWNGD